MPDFGKSFFKGKRVFITGHTGFKGAWLSIWLHELGARVAGFALPPPTSPSVFSLTGLENCIDSNIGDVRDLHKLKDTCRRFKPDIVLHLAAQSLVRESYIDPVGTYETNILGTVNILEACRHVPSLRSVIIVTSDKCYENHEWVWGYRENDPMGGFDPYSSSKGCAELVTQAYIKSFFSADFFKQHNIAVATARAGNVIGGGDWAADRLVPDCIRSLSQKKPLSVRFPDAIRPWQHVLEPLNGYLLLAKKLYENGPVWNGAWNFGPNDSEVVSVVRIVEQINKLWGNKGKIEWGKSNQRYKHEASLLKLDSSKARYMLGWKPRWSLFQALEQTVSWYKKAKNSSNMYAATVKQINEFAK